MQRVLQTKKKLNAEYIARPRPQPKGYTEVTEKSQSTGDIILRIKIFIQLSLNH